MLKKLFPPQNSGFYLFRSAQQIVVKKVLVRMNDNVNLFNPDFLRA